MQLFFDRYISKIKKQLIHHDFSAYTILLDCAHGAASFWAEAVFKTFGYKTIIVNNKPNGSNINENSGALHPEILFSQLEETNADFACAFDGDGDRIVIIDKDKNVFNGDDLLTIFAEHPAYKNETVFAGTIMSNQAVENYINNKQKQFIRTDVGDKHIASTLNKKHALLGTEPSGHIIINNHSFCSDGIFAALLFLTQLHQIKICNYHFSLLILL